MNAARALLLIALLLLPIALAPCAADQPNPSREPNFVVDASAALVNAFVQRPVDRTEPVREVIQDVPVCGVGRTVGTVHAELIPDPCRAVVDIALQGAICSRTIGTRGTILIHTATTTPFEVRRRIVADDRGFHLFPGRSCAVSMTQLVDVTSTMDMDCLAIRMTRRGFEGSRSLAEAESAWKSAWRVSQRMDDELAPDLTAASSALGEQLAAFRRAGLALDAMGFSTTATALQGRFQFATPGRTPPTPVSLPDFDLAVRIHESVATEAAQAEFGGRAFPIGGISKVYADLTRGLILDGRKNADPVLDLKTMEKLLAGLAGKQVTVNLAKKDPLIVTFADQGFRLEGRVASIREDKTEYAGLRIIAAYRLENARDGVYAVRKGGVQFILEKPAPGQKQAELPAADLLLIETLFGEFMKERIKLGALPLPEALASRLGPPRAYARNGWFALVWKLR